MDLLPPDASWTLPAVLAGAPAGDVAVECDGNVITYGVLDDQSARVATGLRRLGVEPGDRVAIWLPNTDAWVVCFFACARIGAIAVAVNTRFRSSELADVLGRSGAKLLVLWPGFKQIDFAGIIGDCEPETLVNLLAFVTCDAGKADGAPSQTVFGRPVIAWRSLTAEPPLPDVTGHSDSGCVIFTTSGTSSRPKLVLHDQRTLVTHARNVSRDWGLDCGSVTLLVPPLCGIFGLCTMLSSMAGGGKVLMSPVERGRRRRYHRAPGRDAPERQ